MELANANDIFRQGVEYLEGRHKDGTPGEYNLDKADECFHLLLNHNPGSDALLYCLGSSALSRGHIGLALVLLSQVVSMNPKFGEAWNNRALAYKSMRKWGEAEYCFREAFKILGTADVMCNLAALNTNRNRPEKALNFANRALNIDPNHAKAKWHKALALLEMRKWDEAWDYHEARLCGGASEDVAKRNYHGAATQTPPWDGKSSGLIVIHGEQGMGDEVMFASCISDAIKVPGTRFIFEPSPRMEAVFRRAFPEVIVYGTNEVDGRGWINQFGKPDFKVGLGTLPMLFRRTPESFPGTPYLVPDKAKAQWWGDKLKALPKKPNIGIAWQGGVEHTGFDARSFHPTEFKSLFEAIDANWISLQYDDTAQACVKDVREKLGVRIHHWPQAVEQINPATGKMNDLDDLVALISKLDCVVTVCQTAVHIAGALGVPVMCLTPSEPSWRYGAESVGDSMPWYSSVRLYRQKRDSNDWAHPIANVIMDLLQTLRIMSGAVQADLDKLIADSIKCS